MIDVVSSWRTGPRARASLELIGARPLEPEDPAAAADNPDTARFLLPALDQRLGADPSWQHTLDTLRAPRRRDQKPWEWRKESPIRPVDFRDPGNIDNHVVHLHLEHRVVQRLLGRFLSQGFVHDELTRACVVLTDDPTPRVIALGRLSLYGERAARLHDEQVSVAAEWLDPASRGKKTLSPMSLGERDPALAALEQSLANPRLAEAVPERVRARLLASAARDVEALAPHLERRAAVIEKRALRDLDKRGEREAVEMRAILEAQRARIERHRARVERHDQGQEPQLLLPGLADEQERRQLEADKRYWRARLDILEQEIRDEPERVRASYRAVARRVEPVGLCYLWPVAR